MNKIFAEMMSHSDARLESAHILIESGNYNDSVSRSYYAILDAARTLMASKEIFPKSHAGTIHKFNQHFIQTNLMPKKYGVIFSRAEKLRTDADYDYKTEISKSQAEDIYKRACEFVDLSKKLLGI